MKTPIRGVVPQPGTTLPYSELRGLRISPKRVRCDIFNFIYFNKFSYLSQYYIRIRVSFKEKIQLMDNTATIFGFSIVAILVAITGYSIYTAFGPPSAELGDPFEDHED